jgi:polysaccharide export outer membrane protein
MTRMPVLPKLMLVVPLVAALHAQTPAAQQPAGSTPPPVAPGAAAPARGSVPAAPRAGAATPPAAAATAAAGVSTTSDYVIGPGDVLAITFWREQDLSGEVVVRPDGRISIPLLNEIEVNGLSTEQLREKLAKDAQRFVQDPTVSVVVKQINSRKVYITGQVSKPGPYPLTTSMNVLQLISTAGGLQEYADEKNIVVMRTENGKTVNFKFNYKDVMHRKKLQQNIDLKPGDTVIVP